MADIPALILHALTYPSAEIMPWLFPKLLGAVYCLAFTSLLTQVEGLYGTRGILPIHDYLAELKAVLGRRAYRLCPTLFWLNDSDSALTGGAILGSVLALLLIADAPPVPLLFLLWLLYLSYVTAGQEFLGYQWDALLLEIGFMTIFLPLVQPAPYLVVFTYRLFLFRFMFSSGVVKLASGDPTWRNLTALSYHYETQPLPNRLGWLAHHMPVKVQKLATLVALIFELAVPFLAFGPAQARLAAFLLLVFFQGLIFATGNYGFFNILAAVLAVPLLDDRHFGLVSSVSPPAGEAASIMVCIVFFLFIILNCCQLLRLFHRSGALHRVLALPGSLMISNSYGLFAVMTTTRYEFIVEGSNDQQEWLPYEFYAKPGNPFRPPRQVAPHQPRLDWQMWFAALDPRVVEPWLAKLLVRLLEGSPAVLHLLDTNPFPAGSATVHPPYRVSIPVCRR